VRLVIKELPDEVLVYDLDTDKAYCLNQTAALVWKNCDGQQTVAQLRQLMAQETNSAVPEEMVWLALDQLDKFQLLETVPIRPACLAGMKRRELVRSIGVVAMALPLIMSIAAPTAAQGASPCQCTSPNCRPAGCPCFNNNDCVNKCQAGICN
jgi:hypothetical protein